MNLFNQRSPKRAEPRPLGFQIIRNVAFSIGRKLISGPIFILIVPFTLHRVGLAGYGVWSILGTITGLGWVVDLGLSQSVTKYVAEYRGSGDGVQLRRLLDTSCAIYLLIAFAAALILQILTRPIIGELFRGPGSPPLQSILPLWDLLVPMVAVGLLLKPFIAVVNGFQRLDLANVLLFCGGATNAALTVVFLCLGAKVGGLLLAELVGNLINLLVGIWLVRRLLPSIIPNPLRCDLAMAGKICTFSLGVYSGSLMNTVQEQMEKLYLALLVGVVPVGWYGMALDAASKVRRLPDLLLSPVMAAASELDAADERHKVSQLYFRSQKYTALAALPLVAFALVDSKALVTLWIGPNLSFIAVPFALLICGNLCSQIGSPVWSVLTGRGILRPSIYTALLTSALNVIFSLIFIIRWGFVGAAWGSVLSVIFANAYYFFTTQRYFAISFLAVLRQTYLKPALCSMAAAGAMFWVNRILLRPWPRLFGGAITFAIIYLLGLILTRFFDEFDFSKLEAHVPYVRLARRLIPISYGAEN